MHIGVESIGLHLYSIVFIVSTEITKSKLSNECDNFEKVIIFVTPFFGLGNLNTIYNRFYG